MAAAALLGFLLLAGGPPLVVWCTFIANKSFLVLLGLASSFYWLLVLLLTSLLLRGFVPFPDHAGVFVGLLIFAVTMQEIGRYGSWIIHQKLILGLNSISGEVGSPKLSEQDKLSLSLTQGMGHAIAQTTFLYFSWVSLSAGKGTFYVDSCPHMSYFLVAAWLTLGFFMLHCFSGVIAFYGMEKKIWRLPLGVAGLHYLAALTTAFNFIHGACNTVVVLVLLEGLLAVLGAALVCVHQASSPHRPLATSDPSEIS